MPERYRWLCIPYGLTLVGCRWLLGLLYRTVYPTLGDPVDSVDSVGLLFSSRKYLRSSYVAFFINSKAHKIQFILLLSIVWRLVGSVDRMEALTMLFLLSLLLVEALMINRAYALVEAAAYLYGRSN